MAVCGWYRWNLCLCRLRCSQNGCEALGGAEKEPKIKKKNFKKTGLGLKNKGVEVGSHGADSTP